MPELSNVVRAFAWVRAYHRDLAKLCNEVKRECGLQGLECLTGNSIDNFQGKKLTNPTEWAPSYAYLFFSPKGREDVLLVVLFTAWSEGITEPCVSLARFEGDNARAKARNLVYRWDEEGAAGEPNTAAAVEFEGLAGQHRWFPMSLLAGAADVKALLVDPLLALTVPVAELAEAAEVVEAVPGVDAGLGGGGGEVP